MMNNNYVIVIIECLLLDVILTARNDNDNGFEKENNGITNKQKKTMNISSMNNRYYKIGYDYLIIDTID